MTAITSNGSGLRAEWVETTITHKRLPARPRDASARAASGERRRADRTRDNSQEIGMAGITGVPNFDASSGKLSVTVKRYNQAVAYFKVRIA